MAYRFFQPDRHAGLGAYIRARWQAGDIDALDAAELCIDLIVSEIGRAAYTDAPLSDARIARISRFVLLGIAI